MCIKTTIFSLLVALAWCEAFGATSLVPTGYITQWTIIGPFANPERPEGSKDRGPFDVDYLTSLGGEAKAKIGPDALPSAISRPRRSSSTARPSISAPTTPIATTSSPMPTRSLSHLPTKRRSSSWVRMMA